MFFEYDDIESIFNVKSNFNPEKKLWAEVIWRAYSDIKYHLESEFRRHGSFKDAKDARLWVVSNNTDVGSFIWACEVVFDDSASRVVEAIRVQCVVELDTRILKEKKEKELVCKEKYEEDKKRRLKNIKIFRDKMFNR